MYTTIHLILYYANKAYLILYLYYTKIAKFRNKTRF